MKGINKKSYVVGYLLSLGLTLIAFYLVWRQISSELAVISDFFLLVALGVLALTQLMVQLVFFLHLARESKPRWNLAVFSFAALIVFILVFGSLWIMINLNYHQGHQMTPSQVDSYIINDEGIRP